MLEIFPQRILFSGGGAQLEFRSVRAVSIVRRPIPWLSLAIENGALLLLISGGFTSSLTPRNPATFPVLVAVNVVIILLLLGVKWVDVEYTDDSGPVQHAYFTDGSSFGMARALGGADKLSEAVKAGVLLPPERNPIASEPSTATRSIPDTRRDAVLAQCEECGRKSPFPAECQGKVQKCPECGAYMDV